MRLTEEQRSRLFNRNSLSPEDRRDNEYAVRNRLKEFLEFVPDANWILFQVPKEQLRKNKKLSEVLNEETVYAVFDLLFLLLDLLDFAVANGTPKKPYVVKWDEYKGPFYYRYTPQAISEEPFDLAREEAKLWEDRQAKIKPKNKNYPVLRRMTYDEQAKILFINDYINGLIEHYQSDPQLLKELVPEKMTPAQTLRSLVGNVNRDLMREK